MVNIRLYPIPIGRWAETLYQAAKALTFGDATVFGENTAQMARSGSGAINLHGSAERDAAAHIGATNRVGNSTIPSPASMASRKASELLRGAVLSHHCVGTRRLFG